MTPSIGLPTTLVAAAFKPGRCVVVGHSLGSVVGYNVLRSQATGLDVVRYVTVGSPLGIRAIQSGLDLPLEMPRSVRDWYNAMDDRDVVALRPLDAKSFPIQPAIRNKTSVNNKTKNRHGIVGYLDDRDVAKEIFTAL
jgi:pimeloyl-ACP methyl ester carboxylesterase